MDITFTLYDIIQIALMLGACWACRVSGYYKGVTETIDFFTEKGIVDIKDLEKLEENE